MSASSSSSNAASASAPSPPAGSPSSPSLPTVKSDSDLYRSTTSLTSLSPSPPPPPPTSQQQPQLQQSQSQQSPTGQNQDPASKYSVALHTVRIQKNGQATHPVELKYPEVTRRMGAEKRRLSQLSFDPKQLGHRMLQLIRNYWSQPGFPRAAYRSWIPAKNRLGPLVDLVADLCHEVGRLLRDEPRVLSVTAPCLVMGDIHGNLSDLKTYERSLWPKAPTCVNCNYLFLGDYVDRGDHSLESILYLLAMKLVAPGRFYLLRGNHEIAHIQRQYTFGRECEAKFGNHFGRQLWRTFNQVFDVLPIAAIVDGQIFCAHGGIPKSVASVARLAREIPVPLDNPEVQSPAAWEMLWNDPITDNELCALVEMDTFAVAPQVVAAAISKQQQQQQLLQSPQPQQAITKVTLDQNVLAPFLAAAESPINLASVARALGASPPQDDQPQAQQANAPTATTSSSNQSNSNQTKQQQQQQPNKPDTSGGSSSTKTPNEHDSGGGSGPLKTVPSDTSSLASLSPQQILEEGFVSNIKRGTAYLFSDRAVDNFLKLNKLSHVIRAHEVIPTGFAFHGDGRVITIFSSSKYCGLNNQASCVLVDQNKIRILRLDT